jgi:uncharacterized protein (TIGR03435 family)
MFRATRSFVFLIAALSASGAIAQTKSEFEVATIKPTPPDWGGGRWFRMQTAHQLAARNYTLKYLIAAAFNVSPKAISGDSAEWMDSDHWDVLAKTPGETRPDLERQMAMLQALMIDRFHLKFHREQKEMPVYALTVAKGGPRLKESTLVPDATPEGPPLLAFVISPPLVRLPARYTTIGELTGVMQRAAMDRPVLDQTGLKGRYDFDLEWMPDETQFGGALGKPPNADMPDQPDLFAALQKQLGLRLEATRGPVETFVIDSAERPSAN